MNQAEQFAPESVRSVGSLMTLGFRLVSLNSHISLNSYLSTHLSVSVYLCVCLSVSLHQLVSLKSSLSIHIFSTHIFSTHISQLASLSLSLSVCMSVCLALFRLISLNSSLCLSVCFLSISQIVSLNPHIPLVLASSSSHLLFYRTSESLYMDREF